MSYDLAIWEGKPPADDDEFFDQDGGSEPGLLPLTPRIAAYVEALLRRYPDDVEDVPWVSPPVIDEASGPTVYLLMPYIRSEEVCTFAAELAHEHGLVCYDPQGETLRP